MYGRPATPALDRLRRRMWAFQLQLHAAVREQCDEGVTATHRGAWVRLARLLFPDLSHDGFARGHLQALMGVVRFGTDPTRVVRRFRRSELSSDELTAVKSLAEVRLVERRPSGARRGGRVAQSQPYFEATVDLVARGEAIAPRSADWLDSPLWGLAEATLPRLDDLRLVLLLLMERLGLCSPSPAELSRFLSEEEKTRRSAFTQSDLEEIYRASLVATIDEPSADVLALLAGLVADSYITDANSLYEIHRDVFAIAMSRLLEPPILAAIANDFKTLVGARILGSTWDLPSSIHVPSVAAPFMKIETYDRMCSQTFGGFERPFSMVTGAARG